MVIYSSFSLSREKMFHSLYLQGICIFTGVAVCNGHTQQNPFILLSLNNFLWDLSLQQSYVDCILLPFVVGDFSEAGD